jgi:hypothetical protein
MPALAAAPALCRRRVRIDAWQELPCKSVPRACRSIGIAAAAFHRRGICDPHTIAREGQTMISTILIVILVLVLIGALPTWPYSSGWGFYPSGGLGLILLIIIILAVTGRL